MDTKKIGCCFVISTGIAISVFVVLSFASITVTEYGLDYNSITKTLDPEYYTSGYYYLGFGHKFITFPSTS